MFEISKELQDLANKVIEEHKEFKPIAESGCRIVYQYSDKDRKSGGKTVYADTTKVSEKLKAVAQCDFIITFYRTACSTLTEDKMKLLMRHELKHIGINEGKFSIVPHDVEDFSDIIKEHGMVWIV